MAITGFDINGNIEKIDYNSLENAPCYSEYETTNEIIEIKEYEFSDIEGIVGVQIELASMPPVIPNTPYNLTFDDTVEQIRFMFNEDIGGMIAGNQSIVGMGDDTKENYLIMIAPSEDGYNVAIAITKPIGNHMVGLSYINDSVPLIVDGTYVFEGE